MTDLWTEYIGVTIGGKYPLEEFLGSDARGASFRTRSEARVGQPALLILVREADGGERRLEQWKLAAALNSPHLVRILETGSSESLDGRIYYAVTEFPEENVGSALQERALTDEEAREILRTVLDALSYLHARELVYGNLEPAQIVAVEGRVKLAADNLRRAGDSPEASPEADVRGLGLCLYEILTQRRNPTAGDLKVLPQPFQDIVRGCLRTHPEERLNLRQIAAALDPQAPRPAAAVRNIAEARNPETRSVAEPRRLAKEERPAAAPVVPLPVLAAEPARPALWKFVVGAVLLVGIIVWLSRPDRPSGKVPPVAPAVAAAPAPPSPPPASVPEAVTPPPKEPPAAAPPAEPSKTGEIGSSRTVWRVVAYTYARRPDAEKAAARILRKWPDSGAEVFSPKGEGPPYFVALGGRMNRTEALDLQRRAWSQGMPRDTFVRNFSH